MLEKEKYGVLIEMKLLVDINVTRVGELGMRKNNNGKTKQTMLNSF